MASTILGDQYIQLPAGTTAQRPASPVNGMFRFNTDTGYSEYYNAGTWYTVKPFIPISATGGTVTQTTINGQVWNVHTFNYTGATQNFNISSQGNDGSITAYMWGAAGGGANGEGYSDPGGAGGYTTCTFNVISQSITLIAVAVGAGGDYGRGSRLYGGGGLASTRSSYVNGGGGGYSGIFKSSVSFANTIAIAGGGGGGAGHGGGGTGRGSQGGAGGGTTGEAGYSSYQTRQNNGATQSAGGTTSSRSYSGLTSGQLQGADAGDGTSWSTGWNCTGGGGGGYYGGGAIEGIHEGGGGGSGWYAAYCTSSSTESNFSNTNAANISVLYPPQTGNQFYTAGIGRGNIAAAGGHGKVVITYRAS